jgi:glycine/D-amino acid oxidase-like deaminating enzyme
MGSTAAHPAIIAADAATCERRVPRACIIRGMRNDPAPDVVVVGGGIVGTSAAAFLAEAGARVVLVERDGLASGASGANSGVIQHPFDPVLAGLYHLSVRLYRELAAMPGGPALPDRPAGLLYISTSEEAARRQAWLIEGPFPELGAEVIGGTALRAVEPAAGDDLWACRVDVGYPVTPGIATYAYATLAESLGVAVRMGRTATLEVSGDTVTGVRLGDTVIPAGAVLAAAGPWTPELLDPTGGWAPIRAQWGVVVEAELALPPTHVLEEAGIEAVLDAEGRPEGRPSGHPGDDVDPDEDAGMEFSCVPHPGAAAIGSTFLDHEPDPAAWMERILVRATRFLPGVADAPIHGLRSCARPRCVDGRPLLGMVPGRRNLFVCAGHGPWGISTGPGSARLVADLVLGREPAIAAELDPGRFGAP